MIDDLRSCIWISGDSVLCGGHEPVDVKIMESFMHPIETNTDHFKYDDKEHSNFIDKTCLY